MFRATRRVPARAAKGVRERLLQLQPANDYDRQRVAEVLRRLHLALGWAEVQVGDFAAAREQFSRVAEARKLILTQALGLSARCGRRRGAAGDRTRPRRADRRRTRAGRTRARIPARTQCPEDRRPVAQVEPGARAGSRGRIDARQVRRPARRSPGRTRQPACRRARRAREPDGAETDRRRAARSALIDVPPIEMRALRNAKAWRLRVALRLKRQR